MSNKGEAYAFIATRQERHVIPSVKNYTLESQRTIYKKKNKSTRLPHKNTHMEISLYRGEKKKRNQSLYLSPEKTKHYKPFVIISEKNN